MRRRPETASAAGPLEITLDQCLGGILKAWHLPKCSGATSKPPRERPIRTTPTQFIAMPRGRAAPGDPPHLPMGSPSSLESCGPQTSQTLPRANRPPRRRLLWARSGAAFRAALGQGKGWERKRPFLKMRRPAASQRNQKRQKTIVKPADFPVTLEGIWLQSANQSAISGHIIIGDLF